MHVFLLFGAGPCFFLLFGLGTGVHLLTGLPGSALRAQQQKRPNGGRGGGKNNGFQMVARGLIRTSLFN